MHARRLCVQNYEFLKSFFKDILSSVKVLEIEACNLFCNQGRCYISGNIPE